MSMSHTQHNCLCLQQLLSWYGQIHCKQIFAAVVNFLFAHITEEMYWFVLSGDFNNTHEYECL